MFQVFHISKNGQVVQCRAKRNQCPLGGEHFERKDLAYDYLAEQYENFNVPITKTSIQTIYRVGSMEVKDKHFPELDYVISELDRFSPNPSQKRGGSLYFTVSKKAARRWRNKFFSFGSEPEEAVEAVIDPETTLVYNIHDYEKVSGALGNLWLKFNLNSGEGLGLKPEVPEKLQEEIKDYWNSGITIKELWRKVAEGEIKEESLEDYEVFISPDKLISHKIHKNGLDYSKP